MSTSEIEKPEVPTSICGAQKSSSPRQRFGPINLENTTKATVGVEYSNTKIDYNGINNFFINKNISPTTSNVPDPLNGPDHPEPAQNLRRQASYERLKRYLDGASRLAEQQDHITTHHDHIVEGTCLWILDDPIVKQWLLNEKSEPLWIHGRAGVGKTYMALSLVEHFKKSTWEGPAGEKLRYRVLGFFCEAVTVQERQPLQVLKSLLYQTIARLNISFDGYLEVEDYTKLSDLSNVFKRFVTCEKRPPIVLIIDAPEECNETFEKVLSSLRALDKESENISSPFKLIITSRREPPFNWLNFKVDLSSRERVSQTESDVNKLISWRIKESQRPRLNTSECPRFLVLEQRLKAQSESTFLWIGPVLRNLRLKHFQIDEAESTLPSDLIHKYRAMIKGLSDSQQRVAGLILTWVAFGYIDLVVEELLVAVPALARILREECKIKNVDYNILEQDLERQQIGHCIYMCCIWSLLYIDENKGIRLIHKSLSQYLCLQDGGNEDIDFGFPYFEPSYCHYFLSRACFDIIKTAPWKNRKHSYRELSSMLKAPFALYAIRNWAKHARTGQAHFTTPTSSWQPFDEKYSIILHNWFTFNEGEHTDPFLVEMNLIHFGFSAFPKYRQKQRSILSANGFCSNTARRPGMPVPRRPIEFAVYAEVDTCVAFYLRNLRQPSRWKVFRRRGAVKLERARQMAWTIRNDNIRCMLNNWPKIDNCVDD